MKVEGKTFEYLSKKPEICMSNKDIDKFTHTYFAHKQMVTYT
ncbi:MAG: hypothetical protein JWR72_1919 [Flavisolibacter sp.]|nr:hypothetical protein [Flavisolibacter sp.]